MMSSTCIVLKPGLGLGLVNFGLGLVVLVLVLRIWSCSHHCSTVSFRMTSSDYAMTRSVERAL